MNERREEQEYLARGDSAGGRVAFVSRSSPRTTQNGRGAPMWSWRDPALLGLWGLALALQAFSWSQLEGYQLADSVEYMERAWAFAQGETLQSEGAVRSLGFSSLLLPVFAGARALGLENLRPCVHTVRLLQMALGLGLVTVCVHLGSRLAGRRAGLAAGWVCAINPVFLQYSVSPVSGIAAALFVGLGLVALLEPGSRRRSVWGGLALGAAFLMAYQTLLISGACLALLFVRQRVQARSNAADRSQPGFGPALAGFGLGILAQVVLDKFSYGVFGVSIGNYLIENVGGVVLSTLVHLGLSDQEWVHDLYAAYVAHMDGVIGTAPADGSLGSLQPVLWYFRELPSMLVWPVMALGCLGLARAWFQATWKSSLLVGTLAISLAVLSMKGSKSFRLWLPLLPLIAPLCGWGLGLLSGEAGVKFSFVRRLAGQTLLLAGMVLGLSALSEVNTRRYGVFWQAMEFVNQAAAQSRTQAAAAGVTWHGARAACGYHWAVFGRNSADVKLAKLSLHIDQWEQLDADERKQLLHELTSSHWVIIHDAVLSLHSELTLALNEKFEVATSFWDADADRGLRDVLVLRNTSHETWRIFGDEGRRPRRMWEVLAGQDPEAYRAEHGLVDWLPVAQVFEGSGPSGARESLTLLGWDYEPLPNSELGWICYHWWTATGLERDYTLIDRLTVPNMRSWWRNDHEPGRGFFPTSTWAPGSIVREGFVMLAGDELYKDEFNPIGGAFRRGDLIPVSLWFKCSIQTEASAEGTEEETASHEPPAFLAPMGRGSLEPLVFRDAPALADDVFESADGHLAMRDGLVRIGEFFLPVAASFRVPDDGRPVED